MEEEELGFFKRTHLICGGGIWRFWQFGKEDPTRYDFPNRLGSFLSWFFSNGERAPKFQIVFYFLLILVNFQKFTPISTFLYSLTPKFKIYTCDVHVHIIWRKSLSFSCQSLENKKRIAKDQSSGYFGFAKIFLFFRCSYL